jgi:hypothetical protein
LQGHHVSSFGHRRAVVQFGLIVRHALPRACVRHFRHPGENCRGCHERRRLFCDLGSASGAKCAACAGMPGLGCASDGHGTQHGFLSVRNERAPGVTACTPPYPPVTAPTCFAIGTDCSIMLLTCPQLHPPNCPPSRRP